MVKKPLSPADSMKHIVHPEGFELRLFASEEMLGGKPICMNWDERGRLWVAVTVDYPNELQPPGKGRDRILIREDTKGEGKADRVKVFADKLSIPTSLIFARGGVIVHQAPHTLFLRDTDGDGLEDTDTLFWDKTTLSVPVGMVLAPEGIYVSWHGKVSLLRDTDGDGKADVEEVVASGWPETAWTGRGHARPAHQAPRDPTGRGPRLPYRPPLRTEMVEELRQLDMLPAIVFIFSRAACDDAVRQVMEKGAGK